MEALFAAVMAAKWPASLAIAPSEC